MCFFLSRGRGHFSHGILPLFPRASGCTGVLGLTLEDSFDLEVIMPISGHPRPLPGQAVFTPHRALVRNHYSAFLLVR